MSTNIPSSDYIEILNLAFEWAQSYDTKDWERLRRCLAPSVQLDFRGLGMELYDGISPDEYVAILKKIIGDERLKTQHFLGASRWERLSDDSVHVWHQARVAHQRYTDVNLTEVVNKGHGHGVVQHWYKKINEVWKIEGSASSAEWTEYDLIGTLQSPEEKTS